MLWIGCLEMAGINGLDKDECVHMQVNVEVEIKCPNMCVCVCVVDRRRLHLAP